MLKKNVKELKFNQRMLLYYLLNWMSPFHPMDFFLLTLQTIQYPKLFLFVLCQFEHQQTTQKDVRGRWYTVSVAFENIVPRLVDIEKRLDADVFIPN